jgi:hypothetical protein
MKKKYSSPAIKVIKLELTSFMTNSLYWNPTGKKEDKMGTHDEADDPIEDDEIE